VQSDLLQVVKPFGAVTKLVMLRAKNQEHMGKCMVLDNEALHDICFRTQADHSQL
jgi:hypothetical protein